MEEITLNYFGLSNSGRHIYGNDLYIAALKEQLKDGENLAKAGKSDDGKTWLRKSLGTIKVKIA